MVYHCQLIESIIIVKCCTDNRVVEVTTSKPTARFVSRVRSLRDSFDPLMLVLSPCVVGQKVIKICLFSSCYGCQYTAGTATAALMASIVCWSPRRPAARRPARSQDSHTACIQILTQSKSVLLLWKPGSVDSLRFSER